MVHNEGRQLSAVGAELWAPPACPGGLVAHEKPGWASTAPKPVRGPSAPVNVAKRRIRWRTKHSLVRTTRDSGREGSRGRVSANEGNSACPPPCVWPPPPHWPHGAPPSGQPAWQPDLPWPGHWQGFCLGPSLSPAPSQRQLLPPYQTFQVGVPLACGTALPLGGVTGRWASLPSVCHVDVTHRPSLIPAVWGSCGWTCLGVVDPI